MVASSDADRDRRVRIAAHLRANVAACAIYLHIRVNMKLPTVLQQLYDVWMMFSHALGRVMSFLLLTLLWIIGIGSYALIRKCIMLVKGEPTGWQPAEAESNLEYQF